MTKIEIAKKAAKFVVGASVSFTVGNVIGNNVNPEKPYQKVEAWIGGVIIGTIVAEQAESWLTTKFEAMSDAYNKAKEKN